MIYGLDEYYSELLLEAKSEEEIKKILEYQFVKGKGVPQDVLDYIFNADPTKKKSFTKWVLMQWERDKDSIMKAVKSNRIPKLFQYFQERAGSGLSLNAMPNFDAAMEKLPEEDPILGQRPDGPAGDFEFVYDTPEWKIAVPHTYEADRFLGQGCRWCTAGAFGDSSQWWNRYSSKGPIWVNFDMRQGETCPMDQKEYPYTRYQFLFEWEAPRGELMDCHDRRVDFERMDMPEEVKDFYEEQDPEYRKTIDNEHDDPEERWEDYNQERWDHSQVILAIDSRDRYLSIMPEEEEDYIYRENCDYYVYDEEDSSDPISWHSVNPSNAVVEEFEEDMPLVIVRDNGNDLHAFTWDESGGHGEFSDRIISFYKKINDNCVAFIEGDRLKIYNLEGCYSVINVEADVSNIRVLAVDTSNIKGYEDGFWLQIDSSDGYSCLWYVTEYSDGECVIIRDKPIGVDGDFTLEVTEDGQAYFVGQFAKHWLGDGDAENRGFNVMSEVADGIYIVKFKNYTANLYDAENKRMVLQSNVKTILPMYENLLCITTQNNLQCYYNPQTLNVVLPLAKSYNRLSYSSGLWIGYYSDYIELYYMDGAENPKHIGKFKAFVRELDKQHYLMTAINDNKIHVVDIDGNIDNFPITKYGVIYRPYVYVTQSQEAGAEVMIYNYIKHEIVYRNSSVYQTEPFLIRDNNIYIIVKSKSGYYNILCDDKLLLNNDTFKHIYKRTNCPMIIACTLDRIFFFDVEKMEALYPKNGINKNNVVLLGAFDDYFIDNQTVKMQTVNGANFSYNPYTQVITPRLPNNLDAEEALRKKQEIMQYMGDEIPQIAESFKKIYDKINNTRNNTL